MNETKQNSLIMAPTKKQLVIVCLTWIIGVALILLAVSDFFAPLSGRISMILGFITGIWTVMVLLVVINYFRKPKE